MIVTVEAGWLALAANLLVSVGIVIGALVAERAGEAVDRDLARDREAIEEEL